MRSRGSRPEPVRFFDAAYAASARPVRLIDADADLFTGLAAAATRASAALTVSTLQLRPGPWRAAPEVDNDQLTLLVFEGVLVRTVSVAGHRRSELIGDGDLIRPWNTEQAIASLRFDVGWDALQPTRLGLLDAAFFRAAGGCPELVSALVTRGVQRSHRVVLQMTMGSLRRVEERLIALFLHLGDRWGRMTPEGVHIPLRMTHELIAQLVGAQRPTVTTGLNELERAGRLKRRADRTWLVTAPLDGSR